ncbi:MAG: hypothetical protein ACLPVF_11850 [Acidimicrobiales bacterium]
MDLAKIARYQVLAESELEHAHKAGRLDAQQVHAARSVAASNLALIEILLATKDEGAGSWLG